MMSFLIIITMITNNFWIFCSSFSIFALWLAKWWLWNSSVNNIYASTFFFTLLVVDLTGRFIVWAAYFPAIELNNESAFL